MYSGKYIIQIYNWARWKLWFRFNFQLPAFFKSFRKLSPFVWNSKEYIHTSPEHLGAAIFPPHCKREVESRCEVNLQCVFYLVWYIQSVTLSPCGASHISGTHRPHVPGGSCIGRHRCEVSFDEVTGERSCFRTNPYCRSHSIA